MTVIRGTVNEDPIDNIICSDSDDEKFNSEFKKIHMDLLKKNKEFDVHSIDGTDPDVTVLVDPSTFDVDGLFKDTFDDHPIGITKPIQTSTKQMCGNGWDHMHCQVEAFTVAIEEPDSSRHEHLS